MKKGCLIRAAFFLDSVVSLTRYGCKKEAGTFYLLSASEL